MKKSFSLLLALIMMLSAVFGVNGSALAASASPEASTDSTGTYDYYLSDGGAVISAYLGSNTIVHIPETLDGYPVTEIGKTAFFMCLDITEVTLPDSVTVIGESAFHDCHALTEIALGSGLTTIRKNAFFNCFYLEALHLPASVAVIEDNAFKDTGKLATITVADDNAAFTAVDNVLFSKDMTTLLRFPVRNITAYTVPDGVTTIAQSAFYGAKLKDITLPTTLTLIDTDAFDGSRLETIRYNDYETVWNRNVTIQNSNGGNKIFYDENVNFVFRVHEHAPAEAVRENEIAATCTKEGSYDEVIYCAECGEELSREAKVVDKTAHTPVTDEAVAPTCTTAGLTEGSHCAVCGEVFTAQEEVPATGHRCRSTVTTPATCAQSGIRTIACVNCDYHYTVSIPKLAHTPGEAVRENEIAATCAAEGSYDEVTYCTVCGEELSRDTKKIAKLSHTPGEAVRENETAATCTAEGSYDEVTYCTDCGTELSREARTTAKLAHTPGEAVRENEAAATCTADGSYDEVTYCTACGTELRRETKMLDKIAHTPVTDEAVAPTCTAAGLTEGSHCAVCGEVFTAQKTLPALGHDFSNNAEFCRNGCGTPNPDYLPPAHTHRYAVTETVPATCTADGSVTYTCTDCGETYTEALPMVDHTPVTDEAVAPTCTTAGLTEGSHCAVCGQVLTAQQTIPALAHHYIAEETLPATCTAAGLWTYTCSRCGDRYTVVIPQLSHTPGEAVRENEIAATCTAVGSYDEVTYCTECGTELSRDTKTTEKLAHTPGDVVRENETAATCTADGSYDEATYCTECGTELSRETKTTAQLAHTPGKAVRENETAATCTAEGSYDEVTYCTECNTELSRETKTTAQLAHTPGEAVRENETAATCTADGSYDEVIYCAECGEELSRETKVLEKIAHTPVTDEAVAPTCTAAGLTEGSHCAVCGEVFTAQEAVPATGHHGAIRIEDEVAATCTENGSYIEVLYCTNCGNELGKEGVIVPATGHRWNSGEVTKQPTTTATGIKTYTCTVCGETKTETIPKLPAKNGWVTENGKKYYYKNGTMLQWRQKIDGKFYYFNSAGVMQKGWIRGNTWMYGDSDGVLATSWRKIGSAWYLFDASGSMLSGWQKSGGKWYYLRTSGAMVTGWQKISGKWYLFAASGAMLTGWQKSGGSWYYLTSSGAMATGWQKISGKWYYFESSGAMRTAALTQGGKTYTFSADGQCTNP